MRSYSKSIIRLILLVVICIIALAGTVRAGGDPRFRMMNAAPESTPADVYLDGANIFSSLGYKTVSRYHAVTPGTHRIKVTQAGTGIDGPAIFDNDVNFENGQDYTFVAMGRLGENLKIHQFRDDNSPPEGAGKSRVRFIHTSMDLNTVDVCGTGHTNCFITDLSYTKATEYAVLDADVYSFDLRQAGTNNVIKAFPNVRFNRGEVYTIYIVGLVNGSKPLEIVMSTDAWWEPVQPPVNGAFLSPTAQVVVFGIFLGMMAGAWLIWRQFSKLRTTS